MSNWQTTSARQQPIASPTTLARGSVNAHAVDESAARVLAMLVAASGRIDGRELQALDRLDAFQRLGVTRERVVELAQGCIDVIGVGLSKKAWLRTVHLDALLDEVDDCRSRLFVCRLAAAVLVADGRITMDKRVVYERVLSRWRVSQMMVCRAIMSDPTRAADRPYVKADEVCAKGKTRRLPAGTLERALHCGQSGEKDDRPVSTESADGGKA